MTTCTSFFSLLFLAFFLTWNQFQVNCWIFIPLIIPSRAVISSFIHHHPHHYQQKKANLKHRITCKAPKKRSLFMTFSLFFLPLLVSSEQFMIKVKWTAKEKEQSFFLLKKCFHLSFSSSSSSYFHQKIFSYSAILNHHFPFLLYNLIIIHHQSMTKNINHKFQCWYQTNSINQLKWFYFTVN